MNRISLDLDDSKLHIHDLYASDTAALHPIKTTPSGISATSSISRTEDESRAIRNRPQLELPKQHYMIELLDLHYRVEGAVSKELVVFKAQAKIDLAEIEKLEKEKDDALRKNAEDAASRSNWSVLGNVAQYLAAGTSIAVGLSIGPAGWGSWLIASGAVGLGNRIVRDTVGWQSVSAWFTKSVETQKRLVQRIELGFLAIELGTGLAGGLGSAAAGSFSAIANAPRLDNARKLVGTLHMTSSAMTSTSKLGRAFTEKRLSDLQAKMRLLDARAEQIRMEMHQQVTTARDMIDTAQSVGKEMHKAIASSEIQDL